MRAPAKEVIFDGRGSVTILGLPYRLSMRGAPCLVSLGAHAQQLIILIGGIDFDDAATYSFLLCAIARRRLLIRFLHGAIYYIY